MTLESAIGTYEFMSGIDGIYAFINEEFPSQEEEDVLDKSYQGLPDSPDMDNVVYQENSGKAVDTYDQFIGDEVCLSDQRVRRMMDRVTNRVNYNNGNPRRIKKPTLFSDHSLYEVSFTNGQTEELKSNVIAENMLYQVDSEAHHYQVLKDISDHYVDGNTLKRSDVFIRSRGGDLHTKKITRGWKLEV